LPHGPAIRAALGSGARHRRPGDNPRDNPRRYALAQSAAMTASAPATRPTPRARSDFRAFRSITTRWADNDVYGHVNNVVYYSWCETAVSAHLIEAGALDSHGGPVIGLVVETQCHYLAPLAFPQTVAAGLRVAHLGSSSVRYEVGLFAEGEEQTA